MEEKAILMSIRYRGVGRVCFLPPLFCPTKFVKSSDQFSERKARRRRKNFEVTFFKKLTFLGKFYGFLAAFSASTTKKARHRQKIWECLFCARRTKQFPANFSFSSETPSSPWINLAITYGYVWSDNVCTHEKNEPENPFHTTLTSQIRLYHH